MDDKNNDFQPVGDSSLETLSRAERIKAIKNSINKKNESMSAETVAASEGSETPEKIDVEGVLAPKDEWESEIAERIAKRVQKMKAGKSNSADIIPEVSEESEEIAENVVAEETRQEISENEVDGEEETMPADEPQEINEVEPIEQIDETEEVKPEKTKKSKKKKKKKKSLGQSLIDLLPQRKDSVPERIRKVFFLGSCAAIIVCGTIVADYYIDTTHTENLYDDIGNEYLNYSTIPQDKPSSSTESEEVYTLLPNAERLLEINNEVVGFISIPGTEVAYPVMQSDDLEKYLDKNIMGEDAKAGSLFLDYRSSFDHVYNGKLIEPNTDNLIIYGHNMENGNMFGTLKKYRNDSSYYGNHPIIQLNSNYKQYQYKIFAFFIIDAEDETETAFECWNNINFADETDFYNFVNEAKKRTIRLNDVDVEYGDKLLTLSTCNGIFGQHGPGRLIVLARQVRDGEDPYEGTQNSTANPNIKWPSLYYKYNSNEKYDPEAEFIPYGETSAEETATEE